MRITCSLLAVSVWLLAVPLSYAQTQPTSRHAKEFTALIDQYSQARENRDTVLLKKILTDDIDQLVSTGEWRTGLRAAVEGMMASSANTPGERTLVVDRIKVLGANSAIVDCRYEIKNTDGTSRKMWSSFNIVNIKGSWKISAIRNMLPAGR
jgi:uncharacterized protein (TIGR02246 family)